ncbi:60S ribosomal protein L13-1 [Thalictrum thalictroides]|uniref:60S ribosomal protein L13 n=1 Tax=Thalictrum thalictroides TaxID=46969 RepID=A0A7J6XHB4_THATH|nr:60S ribosomal protein L13-1 [Thalictrum thalictroides]
MLLKHNNVIPNGHFKKHCQNYVKTWFNQLARKTRRCNARQKKAGRFSHTLLLATLKYKMKVRAGRGFSLEELKAAGIPKKLAPTIHRRRTIPWGAFKLICSQVQGSYMPIVQEKATFERKKELDFNRITVNPPAAAALQSWSSVKDMMESWLAMRNGGVLHVLLQFVGPDVSRFPRASKESVALGDTVQQIKAVLQPAEAGCGSDLYSKTTMEVERCFGPHQDLAITMIPRSGMYAVSVGACSPGWALLTSQCMVLYLCDSNGGFRIMY